MTRSLVVALLASVGACSSRLTQEKAAPSCTTAELVVATSDYASSALVTVSVASGASTGGLDLGKDLQLASAGEFAIGRDFDAIFSLDPCGRILDRFSVHDLAPPSKAGTFAPINVHDAAMAADGSTFVAIWGLPKIAVVRAGAIETVLDTSAYDSDGNPQADAIRIVGTKAFVTLERLDDNERTGTFPSRQPSSMLRIDVASRRIEAAIELAGRNPFGAMAELDGALYLAEPRNFDIADEENAGIEVFDTTTNRSRMLVTEHAVGGSVSEVAVTSGCGAAIVAAPIADLNPTSVVTFDPVTGAVGAILIPATPGYDLQGLAWRGDTLYVGDRRPGIGGVKGYAIHVFDRDPRTCILRASNRLIDLPQQPVALRPTP